MKTAKNSEDVASGEHDAARELEDELANWRSSGWLRAGL